MYVNCSQDSEDVSVDAQPKPKRQKALDKVGVMSQMRRVLLNVPAARSTAGRHLWQTRRSRATREVEIKIT
jgi:hypothetical protein